MSFSSRRRASRRSRLRRKDWYTRWYTGALFVIILFITANPVTGVLYRIPVPVITSSSPTLMSFLLAFSLAVFCGRGLDYWMTEPHSVHKLMRRTLQTVAVFAVLIAISKYRAETVFSLHGGVMRKALLYGMSVSAATLGLFWVAITRPKLRIRAVTLLLFVHTFDLFIFFHRFNPFVPVSFVFPDHPVLSYLTRMSPKRYWGYGTAGIAANFASQYGIFSPEGYDPLYPAWYGEFLYSYRDGSLLPVFDNATRSDAAIVSSFGDGGLSDTKKEKVLRALSVSAILDRTENASTADIFPPDTLTKAYETADWSVYQLTHAAPRAYITGNIRYYTDKEDFSRQFFAADFDPSSAVLLPEGAGVSATPAAAGNAVMRVYEPERVIVQTESTNPTLLVITDTFYPGWQADVDGKPVTILPANWTLRAVPVPAGTHDVTFTYAPKSMQQGILLSMISGTGLCILLWYSRKKHA